MKRPFRLVDRLSSNDTETHTKELWEHARGRRLIGLATVAIYEQRAYEIRLCGEALRSPTFTRGAVGALMDKLGRLQRGEPE